MTTRNEITDLLIDELEKYGLKGTVEDRSKHLEVSWEGNQGRRFVICPKTPSDWRSALNTRSDMRKILRKDEQQFKEENPLSFSKAMSLPKEPIVTFAARERAMQKDIETLCELVLELTEKTSLQQSQLESILEKMNSIQVVSTVTSTVSYAGKQVQAVKPREEARPLMHREGVTSNEIVLGFTGYEWTPVSQIIVQSGFNKDVVNQCLMRLRKRGLVENGLRGFWRKTPHDNIVSLGSGNQS